jgi:hypothetical protein
MPHSGMPGPALRAGVAQHQDVVGRDVEVGVVDGRLHLGVVVEHQRGPLCLQQVRRAGRGLMTHAVGREVAAQHRERALGVDRPVERADDVVVEDLGAGEFLAQRAAVDGQRRAVEQVADARHQRRQAAGVEEVLHQVGSPLGRMLAITGVRAAGASKSSSVTGTPARRAIAIRWMMALVEQPIAIARRRRSRSARGQQPGGRQVLPHHLDDARRPQAAPCAGGRRRRRDRAGRRAASGPSPRRCPVIVEAVPIVMQVPWLRAMPASTPAIGLGRCVAGAALVPVLPGVRAGAQHLAASCRAASGRRAGRRRAGPSDSAPITGRAWSCRSRPSAPRRRPGGAQQLLGLHRQEVAVEHGRRLDESLAERDRRQLDREAAGLQHAALDVLDALLEVRVAGFRSTRC